MQFIQTPLDSLLKASWQSAVLILLVLIVQWTFRRRLHPRWRYALWLLVAVRLALFWAVPARVSVFNLIKLPSLTFNLGANSKPPVAQPTSAATTSPRSAQPQSAIGWRPRSWGRHSLPITSIALGIWALGGFSLAVYLVLIHRRVARSIARLRPVTDTQIINLFEDCREQMDVRVPVSLVETPEAGSPSLFGFMRPRLLLPAGLTQTFTSAELRCVFLHELGHVKRHDILIGWLTTALQLVHWFNPLVWFAFYRMRLDRELACDALALAHAGEAEHNRYGQTILKLLESFGRPAWAPSLAGAVESHKQLKERIRMIAQYKQIKRGPAFALVLVAGLGVLTFTDAQQPAPADLRQQLTGTWILVGRPGLVAQAPVAGGRTKSFTDAQWSITQTDPKDGTVIFHHGGPYTLHGNEYVETISFANDNTKDKIGKTHKYTLAIEGDLLKQVGIDNNWKEVWQRVKPDAPKPQKTDVSSFQGSWHGQEAGAPGVCTCVIRASTLEYHGANTNEWYKADIAVYDTNPKQMVVTITECPFPQYAGATAYAIYQFENGTLTISGNEPGSPVVPASFNAPGARKMVFTRD